MNLISVGLVLSLAVCASPEEAKMVREAAVAGQFYPGDAESLGAMVKAMLSDANPPSMSGKVVGIQVPHAGYPYSGPTAAAAYKLLEGMDSVTVVMLGTSHRVFLDKAAVYDSGGWKTPLGDVPVDEELARSIVDADEYVASRLDAHQEEHSLEVQVPFLQAVLADFRIVPIMLLKPSWEQCERVGKAVAKAVSGRNVVLLASSDLYHGESYSDARRIDSVTTGHLAGFDPEGLHRSLRANEGQACGGAAMVVLMVAARELGADNSVVLARTNSNDVMGVEEGYCVGYSATAFVASAEAECEGAGARSAVPGDLDVEERRYLLGKARETIEAHVSGGELPDVEPTSDRLRKKRGIFVTLHKQGMLRGCIGYVEPSWPGFPPLYQAVRDMAVAAASEDPRFPPVRSDELDDVDIEVTVMSPLTKASSPEDVIVGTHGVVLRGRGMSGLFLPQVPVEQGWDRETYLDQLCRKAGLSKGAWQEDDTELFVFTGQVFGEE